jgi:glycosyltransferase involved in cell wall biosynthesis
MKISFRYVHALHRADFAIIPYRRDRYSRRSSGIFFEALAAGIPVLITSDLAVQIEAEESGAAIFFDDGDENSFHRGLREMKERYLELKGNAEKASRCLETTHSAIAIVERLAEIYSSQSKPDAKPA